MFVGFFEDGYRFFSIGDNAGNAVVTASYFKALTRDTPEQTAVLKDFRSCINVKGILVLDVGCFFAFRKLWGKRNKCNQ